MATVFSDVRCHPGEGATYDAATGTAYWLDILERRLFEAHVYSRKVTVHDLAVMASALATVDAER